MAGLIDRRSFIGLVAGGILVACSGGTEGGSGSRRATTTSLRVPPAPRLKASPFALGVASGDPLPDRVVIWTRLAPDPLEGGGMPEDDFEVLWEVAEDSDFRRVVRRGLARAPLEHGHSVHVDVDGLEPGHRYFYRFRIGEHVSRVGRTTTAPAPGTTPDRMRLAFASCQNWEDGHWAAWRHAADENLDLIVFLGDFIYETDPFPGRARLHHGPEPKDAGQYRVRYGQYLSDQNLQAARAKFPWLVTWDDHEVENNYAGLQDENGSPPEEFARRRADAYEVWWEHMPIRSEPPRDGRLRIYRDITWGDLARVLVLDGRQYRDDQPCGYDFDLGKPCGEENESGRTMLGSGQLRWLKEVFSETNTLWTAVGQQTIMAPMPIVGMLNLDQWDGYAAERLKVLEMFQGAADRTNTVVLTGDIHASGVADLYLDPEGREGEPVATEFVGTSISSLFPEGLAEAVGPMVTQYPWVHWADATRRGYVTCEVQPDRWVTHFRHLDDVLDPDSGIRTATSWQVDVTRPGAKRI
ncbi:MAG: alkaline phosphatase [Acidimicrobiales bacterium]|nr:MAG: alkaline phosphatase [Acidimicrobiales bacterium]